MIILRSGTDLKMISFSADGLLVIGILLLPAFCEYLKTFPN